MASQEFKSCQPLTQHSTNKQRRQVIELAEPFNIHESDVQLDQLHSRRYALATADKARHAEMVAAAERLPAMGKLLRKAYDQHVDFKAQLEAERKAHDAELTAAGEKYAQLERAFQSAQDKWNVERDARMHTLNDLDRQLRDAAAISNISIGGGSLTEKLTAFIKGSHGAAALTGSERETQMTTNFEARLNSLKLCVSQSRLDNDFQYAETGTIDVDLPLYVSAANATRKTLAEWKATQTRLSQRVTSEFHLHHGKQIPDSLPWDSKMDMFFDNLTALLDSHGEVATRAVSSKVLSAMETSWAALEWRPNTLEVADQTFEFATEVTALIQTMRADDNQLARQLVAKMHAFGLHVPSNMTTTQLLNNLTAGYADKLQQMQAEYESASNGLEMSGSKLDYVAKALENSGRFLNVRYDCLGSEVDKCDTYIEAIHGMIRNLEASASLDSHRLMEASLHDAELATVQCTLERNKQRYAAAFKHLVDRITEHVDTRFNASDNPANLERKPTIDGDMASIEASIEKWVGGLEVRACNRMNILRDRCSEETTSVVGAFAGMAQTLFQIALDNPPTLRGITYTKPSDVQQWIEQQEGVFRSSFAATRTAQTSTQSILQAQLSEVISRSQNFVGDVFNAAGIPQNNHAGVILTGAESRQYFTGRLQDFIDNLAAKHNKSARDFKLLVEFANQELAKTNCLVRGKPEADWHEYRQQIDANTATVIDLRRAIKYHCMDLRSPVTAAMKRMQTFGHCFDQMLTLFTRIQQRHQIPQFTTSTVSKNNPVHAIVFFEGVAEKLRSKIESMDRDHGNTQYKLRQTEINAQIMYVAARDLVVSIRTTMGLRVDVLRDDEAAQLARSSVWFSRQFDEIKDCWTSTKIKHEADAQRYLQGFRDFTSTIFACVGVNEGQLSAPDEGTFHNWLSSRTQVLDEYVKQQQAEQRVAIENTAAMFIEFANVSIDAACEAFTCGRQPDLGLLSAESTHQDLIMRGNRFKSWLATTQRKIKEEQNQAHQDKLAGEVAVYCGEVKSLIRKVEKIVVDYQELFVKGRLVPELDIQPGHDAATAYLNSENVETWLTMSFTLLEQLAHREVTKSNSLREALWALQDESRAAIFRANSLRVRIRELEQRLQDAQKAMNEFVLQQS